MGSTRHVILLPYIMSGFKNPEKKKEGIYMLLDILHIHYHSNPPPTNAQYNRKLEKAREKESYKCLESW